MLGSHRDKKTASDQLELELQMVMNYHELLEKYLGLLLKKYIFFMAQLALQQESTFF